MAPGGGGGQSLGQGRRKSSRIPLLSSRLRDTDAEDRPSQSFENDNGGDWSNRASAQRDVERPGLLVEGEGDGEAEREDIDRRRPGAADFFTPPAPRTSVGEGEGGDTVPPMRLRRQGTDAYHVVGGGVQQQVEVEVGDQGGVGDHENNFEDLRGNDQVDLVDHALVQEGGACCHGALRCQQRG